MISALGQAILASGVDDWVPLLAIDGLARQHGLADERIRPDQIIDAVVELVEARLVLIGTVTNAGFTPWNGLLALRLKR